MKSQKEGGWFRNRTYRHLDYPTSFEAARRLVEDRELVSRHSFLPLVSFVDIKRQYRTDNSDLTIPRCKRPRLIKNKRRELRYASHNDAAIYAYYAMQIQSDYEKFLETAGLSSCVIGYRSGIGSNVDLAAAAFAEIAAAQNTTVLCFDIENFFPSIRHEVLKKHLKEILNVIELPSDWYAVFKNICRYAHIDLEALAKVEGFDPKRPPSPLVKDIRPALARARAAGILISNKADTEVPQGTPISAVFANISMLGFDMAVKAWADGNGSIYRRYSDDILLIASPGLVAQAKDFIADEATKIGLTVHKGKTEISRFSSSGGAQTVDRPVTYLGFTFDGQRVSLRPRTLSRYYRRMTYAARSTARGAGKAGKSAKESFKRAVFSEFTHLGRRNFYSYAKRADSKFHNSIVKRQLRRHFQILLRKIAAGGR